MSVVLQKSYRPQIAPAYEGMLADMGTGRDDITRLCETAAGIGFGKAVSQGTAERGCILGGSAFIGVTFRDITLGPVAVGMNDDTANTLDAYGYRANVSIRTLGRIWVKAGANVSAGNDLYYDTTTGQFTNAAGGVAGSGYIDFTRQPAAEETVVIGGVTVTFKTSGASGNVQSNLGPTLGDTIRILADSLNASADGTINDATYLAWPPSPGGAGQGSGAYRLMVGFDTVGVGGNSFGLGAGTSGGTVSGANLAGGTGAATQVTGGKWITSALAGDLAVLNLGIKTA